MFLFPLSEERNGTLLRIGTLSSLYFLPKFSIILLIIICRSNRSTRMRLSVRVGVRYRSLSYAAFDNYIAKIQFRGLVSEEEPQRVHIGRAQSHPSAARQYWHRSGTLPNPQILFGRLYVCWKPREYTYIQRARAYICLPLQLPPITRIDRTPYNNYKPLEQTRENAAISNSLIVTNDQWTMTCASECIIHRNTDTHNVVNHELFVSRRRRSIGVHHDFPSSFAPSRIDARHARNIILSVDPLDGASQFSASFNSTRVVTQRWSCISSLMALLSFESIQYERADWDKCRLIN